LLTSWQLNRKVCAIILQTRSFKGKNIGYNFYNKIVVEIGKRMAVLVFREFRKSYSFGG
jgi:hypothetical protein